MQIFILDYNPIVAVKMLADCHIRKLCMETAQILTGAWLNAGHSLLDWMPRPPSLHHPVIRAIDSPYKFDWVRVCNANMQAEFFRRFDKYHAYSKFVARYDALPGGDNSVFHPVPNKCTFARAFKDFSSDEPDIVEAYRRYYRFKKSIIRKWTYTRACEPDWLRI
ncbi:MAG: hypothetical protein PHI35_07270 [Victivallaceae bacterium]|nr:hypothetical protein [Victivallaceae bacterium]